MDYLAYCSSMINTEYSTGSDITNHVDTIYNRHSINGHSYVPRRQYSEITSGEESFVDQLLMASE